MHEYTYTYLHTFIHAYIHIHIYYIYTYIHKYVLYKYKTQDEFDRKQALMSKFDGDEKNLQVSMQNQLLLMQTQLAQLVVEKSEALEDRNRVFELAELLKEKYTTLMTEKIVQSEELASAEEDKLSLAKALMEEKLNLIQSKEQFEKEKFDLIAETVQTKGEVTDLEVTIDALKKQIDELNSQIDSLRDEQNELKQVVKNFEDEISIKKKQLQEERDKNIDLGAELLTLVNRKDVLQGEYDALVIQKDEMSEELDKLKQSAADTTELVNKHNQLIAEKDAELFSIQKEKSVLEIDNRMLKLAADELAFENRKVENPSESNEEAIQRKEKKKHMKQVRDLEHNLKRIEVDLEETSKEKQSLEKELANLRHKYRDKLSSMLLKDPHDSEPYHVHKRNLDRKASAVVGPEESIEISEESNANNSSATAKLHKQLIDSYAQREENNRNQLDEVLEQKNGLKIAYRKLYDKYREAIDTIEENLPKSNKLKALEEIYKFGETEVVPYILLYYVIFFISHIKLSDSEAYLSSVESEDRLNMVERVKRAETANLQEVIMT